MQSLIDFVSEVRAVDPEMPAQTILAFLLVAEADIAGRIITMREIQQYLEVSSGTCSRITARLGQWKAYQSPGLDFIGADRDPMDRRIVRLRLTPKGAAFARRLQSLMR